MNKECFAFWCLVDFIVYARTQDVVSEHDIVAKAPTFYLLISISEAVHHKP